MSWWSERALDCVPPSGLVASMAAVGAALGFGLFTLIVSCCWRGGACCCRNPHYKPVVRTPQQMADAECAYRCGRPLLAALRWFLTARFWSRCLPPKRVTKIIGSMRDSVSLYGALTSAAHVTTRKRWVVLACSVCMSLLVTVATSAFINAFLQPSECRAYRDCFQSCPTCIPCDPLTRSCGYTVDYHISNPDERFFIFPNTSYIGVDALPPLSCASCACETTMRALRGTKRTGWYCRRCVDIGFPSGAKGASWYCPVCSTVSRLNTILYGQMVALMTLRPTMAGLNSLAAQRWDNCACFLKWFCNLYLSVVVVLLFGIWGIWTTISGAKLDFPTSWLLSPLLLDSIIAFVFVLVESLLGECCLACCCCCCRKRATPLDADLLEGGDAAAEQGSSDIDSATTGQEALLQHSASGSLN